MLIKFISCFQQFIRTLEKEYFLLKEGLNYFEFLHRKNTIRTVLGKFFLQLMFINEKVNVISLSMIFSIV